MPSISGSAVLVSARRRIARLLALGAAAALAVAFMPAAAVATPPMSAQSATASGDWAQFRHDPAHSGYNAAETTISTANVAHLGVVWTGSAGSTFFSPPAVANGVVYAGTGDGQLYAYAVGCASGGNTCSPLWTASGGGDGLYSPAVANGVVYVGSANDNKLYAYDAAGVTGCNGTPKVCTPLWTATVGGLWITSEPSIADGVVYVGSQDSKLYAYDAAGVTGCNGTPKVCTPLWTSTAGTGWVESPAVANGVVYVGVGNVLYAYAVGCASGGGTCTPIWTATTGGVTSPAVADGVVYVGGWTVFGSLGYGKLYAYAVGCASGGGTCTPLWDATVGKYQPHSSPAVANGVVYVGSTDYDDTPSTYYNDKLFAFTVGCASGGGTCTPLWTATTSGRIESSPAVACTPETKGGLYMPTRSVARAAADPARRSGRPLEGTTPRPQSPTASSTSEKG
jgi:outer membrane protein assembly factor BamB